VLLYFKCLFLIFLRIRYENEQKQDEEEEEEDRRPSFHGRQVNESFDCEDEDENRDALLNTSFDRPELQQRLSVHSAVEVGGRRHSGKTVTFCDRRLSDYTCYSHGDHNNVSGIIKPMLKDRRLSDMTGQKSSSLENSGSTGTS